MDIYGRKSINDWLIDNERPKVINSKNVEYVRELNQITKEFSRVIVITYLLITRFGMNGLRQIFLSAQRQKMFVVAVKLSLKEYGVEPKYYKVFDRDIDIIRSRLDHVFKIITENIRLTEYYPYFQNVGFEKLIDFSVDYIAAFGTDDNQALAECLVKEIENYNADHPKEVKEHMETVKDEIEILERHRAKIQASKKAERTARRLVKKAEDEEVREIKRNNEKHRKEQAKIDRSFNYLFK